MSLEHEEISDLRARLEELVDELKVIVPDLSPLLLRWAKIRREVNVITEELEKRGDVIIKTD